MDAEKTTRSVVRGNVFSRQVNSVRLILLILCYVAHSGTSAQAQSQPLSESQIKAGFLFNFTKFVDWPLDAFADSGVPIVLGIVGDTPISALLTVR